MEKYREVYEDGFRSAEATGKAESCPYPEGHQYRTWWICGFDRFYCDRLRENDVPYPFYYY